MTLPERQIYSIFRFLSIAPWHVDTQSPLHAENLSAQAPTGPRSPASCRSQNDAVSSSLRWSQPIPRRCTDLLAFLNTLLDPIRRTFRLSRRELLAILLTQVLNVGV